MLREVMTRMVEGVECPWHGFIPFDMCMKCPYYGGLAGFKVIRCKRQR